MTDRPNNIENGGDFNEEYPLQQQEEIEKDTKRTFKDTCFFVFKSVTVEPILLIFIVAATITRLTSQNLYLEKACRVNLNFTDEICTALMNQEVEGQNVYEREVQRLTAAAITQKTYLTATIPCFLALFIGSFSDKTGLRKVFIIYPIFGQFLAAINSLINVVFFYELDLNFLVFSESLIEGFFGGWCVLILMVFSHIGTITTVEDRTFRIGLLSFSMTVAFPIGMGLSGVLIRYLGYYGGYGVAVSLKFLDMLYAIFFLKEAAKTPEQIENSQLSAWNMIKLFFSFANIKETVIVVFKSGPNRRRLRMIVLIISTTILFGPTTGEMSIIYMFARYKFSWNEVQFSIFQIFNSIIHTIGTIFAITVFSKHLQWHDALLGIIGTASKIPGAFINCFAPNEKIFYLGPVVEIFTGVSMLSLRSIASKLVAQDELGKVNSIFGLFENLMPLLYVPMYTNIYTATMDVLPGAVFLVSAILSVPIVLVFCWLFYDHRKQLRKLRKEKLAENGIELVHDTNNLNK